VFYWTLGKLNNTRRRGILEHIARGNGFVGIHSAADSFRGDKAWRRFIGGYFATHPPYRRYQVSVTKRKSPITEGIDEFFITDEQYITKHAKDLNVLANALWKGQAMPVLSTKAWKKGRVFYTALGHDGRACRQAMFKQTFLRGCLWASGR
jgi:type 1 glutamine amidotransferase